MLVKVDVTITPVAVPVTRIPEEVESVLPIEIEQFEVFSDAEIDTSDTIVPEAVDVTEIPVDVAPTNTAVAVRSGTSIKNHAVPSLAIAQSRTLVVAVLVIGKNRFVAEAVFGVAVWYLNVTVFEDPIAHAPVNVQIRKSLAFANGVG